MRKKIIMLFTAVLAAVMLFSGCEQIVLVPGKSSGSMPPDSESSDSSSLSPYPVVLNGTEITEPINTVISLTPAYTEIICEMGYKDKLIAVSDYCDYPEEITNLPRVASSADPDIDKIAELAPDLVITATPIVSKDRIALEADGIKVLTISAPKTLEEFESIYKLFGLAFDGLFDGEQKGEKAFSDIKKLIDTSKNTDKKKFIYITAAFSPAGGDTFESAVLSLYGENCAQSGSGYDYPPEKLLENQPEIVFISTEFTKEQLENDDIYGQLDAVQLGRVVEIDNRYFERPSERITELLKMLNIEFAPNDKETQSSAGEQALDDTGESTDDESGADDTESTNEQ